MRIVPLIFAVALFLNLVANGQTTQPTPDAWNSLVDQIITTLPTDRQNETLSRLIPDETVIQQFDVTQTETRFRVAEKVNHMAVLWQHSYAAAPATMVTDLSNSLADNLDVPSTLKRQLVPRDPAAVAKADTTAQRWITRILSPDASSLITIVLYWERQPDATAPIPREPTFVLIKGRMVGETPAITQIRYGQLSQALN